MRSEEDRHRLIDGWGLLVLNNCATSTRVGMADQGFPLTMKVLEAKGLVYPCNPGWKVTQAGLDYIRRHRHEVGYY